MKGFTNIITHIVFYSWSYPGDHAAGPNTVIQASHAHVVGVLAPLHEVLISHVAGPVIDHEHATLHPDGAAALEHGVQVSTVTHALIVTASKVSVLVEDDLTGQRKSTCHVQLTSDACYITVIHPDPELLSLDIHSYLKMLNETQTFPIMAAAVAQTTSCF